MAQPIDIELQDQRFMQRLADMRAYSIDSHKIATPLELCREMIQSLMRNSVHLMKKSYLVVSNLEFIYVLAKRLPTMENVWYATPDMEDMGQAACAMGVKPEHLLVCKYETATIKTEMKFDAVISNPPYNPNSLWKKFVELQISLLKDDGKMVTIHPNSWRDSSDHKKIYDILKQNIQELHICDFEVFKEKKINVSTDWYIYSNNYQGQQKIFYSNGDNEIIDLRNINKILRISTQSISYSILNKICTKQDNNIIFAKGFDKLYKKDNYNPKGKYRQCGGEGRGTKWTEGNFQITNESSKHQFENKVVMAYCRKPRARFFSKEENVGVLRAYYWLTNNKSLPLLLNSKMLWKIIIMVTSIEPWRKTPSIQDIPAWLLRTLDFDELQATTEEELYEHYKLTQEEINWVNAD